MTASAAQAQAPPPAGESASPATTWYARNWTRVEWWRFFEPPAGGGDPDYAYPANRLQAGVRRTTRRYAFTAALQHVQFAGLPANAVGPGPLGLGAVYFAHAGRSDSHQLYLRYLNLQLRNVFPGVTIQAGRMPYSSGGERASPSPKVEAVKQQRVAARLVGEFEWSIYQRGYDGVRVDTVKGPWSSAWIAFHPTQGGFEDAAGLTMTDVTVLGGSLTRRTGSAPGGAELQVFALRYNDSRRVAARPDNSGRSATAADVGVNTFGTTLVAASQPRDGRQWDGLLWFAGQTGSWYAQSHRAASVAAEAGHQWADLAWRPWLRGGVLWASGDRDPADDRHGTFFQMLPTVRRYAQSALFSQMNQAEIFAQALLRPTASLVLRADVHDVRLASARDRWYFGSGATQSRGTLFGFSTRPSNGRRALASMAELSADYAVGPHWSVNA
ncbi:MAG: alginate export family protein, partial [Acidobacteria bacterium]|nr:alginate export family protein [Acidobacteriota bacterium]